MGGLILIGENHVGVIMGLLGDAIIYSDSNADGRERIVVGKTILVTDSRIRGFVYPQLLALRATPRP